MLYTDTLGVYVNPPQTMSGSTSVICKKINNVQFHRNIAFLYSVFLENSEAVLDFLPCFRFLVPCLKRTTRWNSRQVFLNKRKQSLYSPQCSRKFTQAPCCITACNYTVYTQRTYLSTNTKGCVVSQKSTPIHLVITSPGSMFSMKM